MSAEQEEKAATQKATFAAGCFWSVELVYQRAHGVIKTEVGYTGGWKPNPTYKEVCTDTTGHAEAVQVEYDPSAISYEQLLDIFWKKHDPTQLNRQGNDIGSQYRSAIFYHNEEQKRLAEESKRKQQEKLGSDKKIVTEIVPAGEWWPAEEYHQRYLEKKGQSAAKGCTDPIRCYG